MSKKKSEPRPITSPRDVPKRLQNVDIYNVRELLELSTIDFVWMIGSLPHARTMSLGSRNSEASREPLRDAPTSILTRILLENPDLCPLPETPTFAEVFSRAADAFDKIKDDYNISGKLSRRRFSLMLGMSGWSGIQWSKEDNQSPVASRLFLLLEILLTEEGPEGLRRFLEVADKEARSRGYANGIHDVFKQGHWGRKKDRKQDIPSSKDSGNKTQANDGGNDGTPGATEKS